VLIGLSMILLSIVLSPIDPHRDPTVYPSNRETPAIEFFHAHAKDFERLRVLVSAHPELIYLHLGRREVSPKHVLEESNPEFKDILSIMARLKLASLNGPASDWGLRMSFLGSGMATGGKDHSFWFCETPPQDEQLLNTLDVHIPQPGSSSIFRQILPCWYLRYDWGG
jgi:hypothetical protein